MRRRTTLALITAASVAAALLLAPESASAGSASFANTSTTPSTTDFDVSTVDLSYTGTAVTVTMHLQNFVGPGYAADVFLTDGPISSSTGKVYGIESSTSTGPDATVTSGLAGSTGGNAPGPASTMGVTVTSNIAAQTITATIPSSNVFWTGGVYVGARLTDATGPQNTTVGQWTVNSLAPLGPVLKDPVATTTTVSLTSPSQVHGSTPAAVVVTVTPVLAGTASILEGTTVVASGPVSSGTAVIPLPSGLSSGSHTFTARFTPVDPQSAAASTSVPFAVTVISVAKATKTSVSLSKKSQTYKKKSAKVSVTVSGKAVGTAAVFDGKKKLKTLTLKKGKASYTLSKKLKKGTHKIKVVYTPKDVEAFKKSTSKTLVLKVKK